LIAAPLVVGISLRQHDIGGGIDMVPSVTPTHASSNPAWHKYISPQNLFGLISVSLMVVALLYGFVFTGLPHSNAVELQLGWVELVSDSESVVRSPIPEGNENSDEPADNPPLTVVIKLNAPSDNPLHFVLPLESETKMFEYGKGKDQSFPMDKTEVENILYTLIVREGNIPIHFENIKGSNFLVDGKKDTGNANRAYYLEFNNLPQNEVRLKNKILRIHYCIHK